MIYVVIPVHNRKAYTISCLADLARQTVREKHVIVVDDGSTDGTAELVAQQFPDVFVVTGSGSLWWAGAMNLGIRFVLDRFRPEVDDFILALNDDVKIEVNYLASLLTAYQTNKPCVVGSVSVDVKPPHNLLYAGTRMNLVFPGIENWATTRFKSSYTLLTKTSPYLLSDSLPGRGMLIPLAVFKAIGLFDEERFQHHMADLDFSISARKAGFPLVVSSASKVYEYTDATGVNIMKPMSVRAFWTALSTTKSPVNRQVRYNFALKHSPLTYLYFGLDMIRIAGGYAIRRIKAIAPTVR